MRAEATNTQRRSIFDAAPERRGAHLSALTALTATRELGRDNLPEVQLRDEGAFTFMTDGPGNLNAVVERQLAALPAEAGLRRVLLFPHALSDHGPERRRQQLQVLRPSPH